MSEIIGRPITKNTKFINEDVKRRCTIGECPFCLALAGTYHSSNCPIFTGFDTDEDLRDIIETWQKEKEIK